jgi:hypothetical protein
MKQRIFAILLIVILAAQLIAMPASAHGLAAPDSPPTTPGGGSSLDSALDEVLDVIKGLADSLIKFLFFLGGLILSVGFVWMATQGALNQAIGNSTGLSKSLIGILSVLGAFIFMLVIYQVGKSVSATMADNFAGDIEMVVISDLAGSGVEIADVSAEDILQSDAIQGIFIDISTAAIRFMISLSTIFAFVGLVRAGFLTQLGSLLGGSGQVASGIMLAAGVIFALVFVWISFPLSQSFAETIVPKLLGDMTFDLPY